MDSAGSGITVMVYHFIYVPQHSWKQFSGCGTAESEKALQIEKAIRYRTQRSMR
jgi:uncharacterized protein involved in tellurium resistance